MNLICRIFSHKLEEIKKENCSNIGFCKRCGWLQRIDPNLPFSYKSDPYEVRRLSMGEFENLFPRKDRTYES